jgi:hypothetical protein
MSVTNDHENRQNMWKTRNEVLASVYGIIEERGEAAFES